MRKAGELKASPINFIAEVIDSLYRLRLIYAQNKGKLQKKPRSEGIRRDKIGRKPKI